MKEILIAVKNKIAMNLGNATYVCDNSDYRVVFDFDAEWEKHPVKTARFKYNGMYQEVVFTGSVCDMPVIRDARLISIGVYAGNLQTSTPAVVHASQSILSGEPAHDDPAEDVYNQLVELVESGVLKGPDGKSAYELAVENGYIGSETDWLASLHGAPGKTPVFGVDYGTPDQIEDIANEAAGILADDIQKISDGKVDKVEGMGLSSNDYDNAAKAKVEDIPEDPKYTDTVYDDTEVKQGINQIKDDLSDKLPKSPANWEAWTAEEQAAARERMGIPGDYELIADVTTEEETEQLYIDKDNDGTDLMLVKAIMFIELPKYEGSLSQLYICTCFYFMNEEGVSKKNSSANTLFSKTYKIYARTEIDLTGGILTANQYGIRSAKGNSSGFGSNFGYDYDYSGTLLYVNKVGYERYNANSPTIPAGTRVKLYGVRA